MVIKLGFYLVKLVHSSIPIYALLLNKYRLKKPSYSLILKIKWINKDKEIDITYLYALTYLYCLQLTLAKG